MGIRWMVGCGLALLAACKTAATPTTTHPSPPLCVRNCPHRPDQTGPKLLGHYFHWQDYESRPSGMYGSSALFLDLDGDDDLDLLVANGNDMAPQPIAMFRNQRFPQDPGNSFPDQPDWMSQSTMPYVQVCAGDLDGNSTIDFVATAPFGRLGIKREPEKGRVDIFLNPKFDGEPTQAHIDETGALGCALGDVDGDGDLDLAVAAWDHIDILLNDGKGNFARAWRAEVDCPRAFAVQFADLDDDGWLDLAVAARRTMVFFHPKSKSAGVPYAKIPDWPEGAAQQRPGEPFTQLGIDVGLPSAGNGPPLFVTTGGATSKLVSELASCAHDVDVTASEIVMHRPGRAERVMHATAQNPVRLAYADRPKDGDEMLVVTQMGEFCPNSGGYLGAPVLFFRGNAGQPLLSLAPEQTAEPIIGEGIAIGDSQCWPHTKASAAVPYHPSWSGGPRQVLTLPRRRVRAVTQVTVDGNKADFAWVPGDNLVELKEPVQASQSVEIRFAPMGAQDVFVTTWNPERGDFLFCDNTTR